MFYQSLLRRGHAAQPIHHVVMGRVIAIAILIASKVCSVSLQVPQKQMLVTALPKFWRIISQSCPGHFCGNGNCKDLVSNLPRESHTMDCCERNPLQDIVQRPFDSTRPSLNPGDKEMTTSIRPLTLTIGIIDDLKHISYSRNRDFFRT